MKIKKNTNVYLMRRKSILEDKLNDLFSPALNEYLNIYLTYCEESFVDLIVLLVRETVAEDIPFEKQDFSHFIIYTEIGEYIKSNYQSRITEYYFRRKTYL
jgi:hypothetical protein